MKRFIFLLQGCLTLIVLAGCLEEQVRSNSNNISSLENATLSCSSMAETNQGIQPDKSSIENLFGCVTFSRTSSDGENTFEDTAVFTADSVGEPVLGGRTVTGTSGSSPVECAELTVGSDDFLCLIGGAYSNDLYVFAMDSQFQGSGTHQLCLTIDDGCSGLAHLDGEPFETPATVTITRETTLAMQFSMMNGLPVSDMEAHDFKLADVHQFGKLRSTGNAEQNFEYQALVRELKARLHSVVAE